MKFYVRYPKKSKKFIKLLIDIEAQKDFYPGYDLLEVIMINLPHKISEDETNPTLNGMLKLLFSPELSKETIMNQLEKIYHIPNSEELEGGVQNMCNFGEAILERGIEQGIEQGISIDNGTGGRIYKEL